MFPVPHHTIKVLKRLKGKVPGTQVAQWLQTALGNWAGLFENFKEKCLTRWGNRKPRPRQEGMQ